MQTEEASSKLREVIAPMASQFNTVLTPLKSAVSSKRAWWLLLLLMMGPCSFSVFQAIDISNVDVMQTLVHVFPAISIFSGAGLCNSDAQ